MPSEPKPVETRILIVEDDPFIAMDLEDAFTEAGYEVCGMAGTVAESLERIERDAPGLATLDYHLGKETSEPVARALEARRIPYCFVSGNADKLENPRAPVIQKPVAPGTVLRMLETLVADTVRPAVDKSAGTTIAQAGIAAST